MRSIRLWLSFHPSIRSRSVISGQPHRRFRSASARMARHKGSSLRGSARYWYVLRCIPKTRQLRRSLIA